MGFHDEKVSRVDKNKEAAASNTTYGVRHTSYEIRRVSYGVFFTNDGNCQQGVDSW